MFKKMKHMKNEKGLTLIELLAVIVILAIIAAIAIPAIGNIINNSEIKATKSDALNILNAASIYVTDIPSTTEISYDGTTFSPTGFGNSIQSLGSFKGVKFYIKNTSGKVTITTGTPGASGATAHISAGGKKVTFTNASIEDINAKDADGDTNVTVVD